MAQARLPLSPHKRSSQEALLSEDEEETPRKLSKKHWKTKDRPAPYALAIINRNFRYTAGLNHRPGAEHDVERIKAVVGDKLGYSVLLKEDLTKREIERETESYARLTQHQTAGSTIIIVSSHGSDNQIYGIDGEPVAVSKLLSVFSAIRCPMLAGKPKIFWLQACRSTAEYVPVEPPILEDDFFLAWSCSEGQRATRQLTTGSLWLYYLCEQIKIELRRQRGDRRAVDMVKVADEAKGKFEIDSGPWREADPDVRSTLRGGHFFFA